MNKPSVKTLEKAFPGKGKQLRKLLTSLDACYETAAAKELMTSCYHAPGSTMVRMAALDECLEGYGVEHIAGNGTARTPSFDYVNMGDAYTTTICRLPGGHYRVCCWGDIVERGNYQ